MSKADNLSQRQGRCICHLTDASQSFSIKTVRDRFNSPFCSEKMSSLLPRVRIIGFGGRRPFFPHHLAQITSRSYFALFGEHRHQCSHPFCTIFRVLRLYSLICGNVHRRLCSHHIVSSGNVGPSHLSSSTSSSPAIRLLLDRTRKNVITSKIIFEIGWLGQSHSSLQVGSSLSLAHRIPVDFVGCSFSARREGDVLRRDHRGPRSLRFARRKYLDCCRLCRNRE